MIITKDLTKLDDRFPFSIHNQALWAKDNREDSFHWHSFCEITYVISGKGNYFVNGIKYDMEAGDLIIFNNVELHGWLVIGEKMEVLVMIFPTELISDPIAMFDSNYLQPFIERGTNFHNKIGAKEKHAMEISDTMKDILREWDGREIGYQLMIKSQVLRILTLLIRNYQNHKTDHMMETKLLEKKKSMKRLEEAFYYINAHYTEKITLEEVAKSVYMSPNYFSTYFKKVTNMGFSDYVTHMRLKKVHEMEKTTDLNKLQITTACGFHNMSNFYRLYKKYQNENA